MEFHLNTSYSNEYFREKIWMDLCQYNNFILNLHNAHPEYCPYPYTLQLHKEFKKNWKDKLFNYFAVLKRTKHYLTISFSYNPLARCRRKIYTTSAGREYVKLDGIAVSAEDYIASSVDLEDEKYSHTRREMSRNITYIHQMEHLEQFGYVYMDNETRITSMEELQSYYADAKGWSPVIIA